MIKMFVLVGTIGGLAITYNTVLVDRPPTQITPSKSLLAGFQAKGFVPAPGEVTMSKEVGHDIFEVPKEDALHLKMAMAMSGMKMEMKKDDDHAGEKDDDHAKEGMKMEGMKMEGMPGMKMEGMKMEGMSGMKMEGMKMEGMSGMKMEGMKMEGMSGMKMEMEKEEAAHGEEAKEEAAHGEDEKEEEGGHGGGSVAEGLTVIAQGSAAEIERELAERGLTVDYTATIDMEEWEYSSSMIMAQTGQVIRLKVKNNGSIPHEFMLMDGPGMSAVNYRLRRADWNLLEHEALAEVPLVLPGGSFEMVVKVHKSGMWMYMCMFPYHMQMGMMGMLMTPDMMGKMGSMMGGMKM